MKNDFAIKRVLMFLRIPKSVITLTNIAYPGKVRNNPRNARGRIRLHLKRLEPLIAVKYKIKLTKKGKRYLREIIEQYILMGRENVKLGIQKELEPYMGPEQAVDDKRLKKSDLTEYEILLELQTEIENAINSLYRGEDRKEESDNAIKKLVKIIYNLDGFRRFGLSEEFRNEERELELSAEYTIVSSEKLYYLDEGRLLDRFMKINKLPEDFLNKISEDPSKFKEFRSFLLDWFLIRVSNASFTSRNVLEKIDEVLCCYHTDYKIGSFLNQRFGIKTDCINFVEATKSSPEDTEAFRKLISTPIKTRIK